MLYASALGWAESTWLSTDDAIKLLCYDGHMVWKPFLRASSDRIFFLFLYMQLQINCANLYIINVQKRITRKCFNFKPSKIFTSDRTSQ